MSVLTLAFTASTHASSTLECVRETLALALEELQRNLAESERPEFWEQLWERYVESKLDYKSAAEVLQSKRRQAGADCLRLLKWLEPLGPELREAKGVALLREVFAQQYELEQSGQIDPVKVHATGVVQNPRDPEAQWSAKGQLAAFRATKPTARFQWELTTKRYSSAESNSRAKNFSFECTNAMRLRALLVS